MAKMADASKQNYLNQQQGMYSMYNPYGQPFPGQPQAGMMSAASGQQFPGQPGMMPPPMGQPPIMGGYPTPDGQPQQFYQQGQMQQPLQGQPQQMPQGQMQQQQQGQMQQPPHGQMQQPPQVQMPPQAAGQLHSQQLPPQQQQIGQDNNFNMQQMAGALPNINQQQQQPGQTHQPPAGMMPPNNGVAPQPGQPGPSSGQPMMAGQNGGPQPATMMPGGQPPQAFPAPSFNTAAAAGYAVAPAVGDVGGGVPPQPQEEPTLISFD